MFMATYETRAFDFTAFGEKETDAVNALLNGWHSHCLEYDGGLGTEITKIDRDEINMIEVRVGEVVRGGGCSGAVVLDALPEAIAAEFSAIVRDELGEHLEAINKKNADNAPDLCATHDYCDANMLMLEAFEKVMFREPFSGIALEEGICSEGDTQRDCDLLNAAWTISATQAFKN
tara:strand:- start:311 stop:838 length:528 start_codon:yes stop_codon:yes gene_type:complete